MGKSFMSLISSFVLIVMLLMASEMGQISMVAEARTCESKSNKFKGVCVSETNCGGVCKQEGFTGGNCRGLRRRCFCTRHC